MKATTDYQTALAATQKFHTKQKGFSGRFLLRYLEDVKDICKRHQVKTMLDYGCGRGEQYEIQVQRLDANQPDFAVVPRDVLIPEYLGVEVTKYDPGYPPFATDPTGQFDLVICTQVLGSIPVGDLEGWVLDRIFSYATKAVYFGEVLNDAPRKTLHASLARTGKMPHGWSREQWVERIERAAARHPNVAAYLRTKDKRSGQPKGARFLDVFKG